MRLVTLPNGVKINPEHVVDVTQDICDGEWVCVSMLSGTRHTLPTAHAERVRRISLCQSLQDEVCSLIEGPSWIDQIKTGTVGNNLGVWDWNTKMVPATVSAVPLSAVTTAVDTGLAGKFPADDSKPRYTEGPAVRAKPAYTYVPCSEMTVEFEKDMHPAYKGVDLSQPPINWTPGKDHTGANLAFVTMGPSSEVTPLILQDGQSPRDYVLSKYPDARCRHSHDDPSLEVYIRVPQPFAKIARVLSGDFETEKEAWVDAARTVQSERWEMVTPTVAETAREIVLKAHPEARFTTVLTNLTSPYVIIPAEQKEPLTDCWPTIDDAWFQAALAVQREQKSP